MTLTFGLDFKKNHVQSISLILLKVGIPNLVGGCNFRWWSVTYDFWVTLTLTSDLVCRIMVSRAYLLYYLGIPNLLYGYIFGC